MTSPSDPDTQSESSSLAAANLAMLGFSAVSDLVGGHQVWVRAGHDVVAPDHTSLDCWTQITTDKERVHEALNPTPRGDVIPFERLDQLETFGEHRLE